jgi:hypothetical protein
MSSSCSSQDEAAIPKTLRIENKKVSRSPTSSFTDSWIDSSDLSMNVQSNDSNNQDETQVQSSDTSEWSEMSFQSDTHPFASPEKVCANHDTAHQRVRPPLMQINEIQNFNDSFDDIVLRETSDLFSPTGVMDFAAKPQQQQKKGSCDALAFVDDDEVDHVFADKDDSFVMKSPEPAICHPVFLSPSRFEI